MPTAARCALPPPARLQRDPRRPVEPKAGGSELFVWNQPPPSPRTTQRIVEVLVEDRRGPRIAAAAAHAPPAGTLDKVSQHPLSYPRATGGNSIGYTATSPVPPQQKAAGGAAPAPATASLRAGRTKLRFYGAAKSSPGCNAWPLGPAGKLSSGGKSRRRRRGPALTAPAAGNPCLGCSQLCSRCRAGVAPTRLTGPPPSATLSCSARRGDSSERVSGARRGGKVARGLLAAALLPLLRLRLLPRCCSAGRRRGESTSAERGWSHGVRGRRQPRTARCGGT